MKLHDYEAQEAARVAKIESQGSAAHQLPLPRYVHGRGAKSIMCYRPIHEPKDCKFAWCDCECHEGESQEEKLERATGTLRTISSIVQAAKDNK